MTRISPQVSENFSSAARDAAADQAAKAARNLQRVAPGATVVSILGPYPHSPAATWQALQAGHSRAAVTEALTVIMGRTKARRLVAAARKALDSRSNPKRPPALACPQASDLSTARGNAAGVQNTSSPAQGAPDDAGNVGPSPDQASTLRASEISQ